MVPTDQTRDFQDTLEGNILESEYLRARTMAAFGLAGLCLIVVSNVVLLDPELAMSAEVLTWVLLPVVGFIAYEVAMQRFFRTKSRAQSKPPAWVWYANAAIEASFPTALIAVVAVFRGPEQVLAAPVVPAYYIFIFLTTLRLSVRISIFSGMVSALGFAIVSLYTVSIMPADAPIQLRTLGRYWQNAALMVIAGFVAALLAREIRRRTQQAFETVAEKERILTLFGQQTSPVVVEELLKRRGTIESERRHVCIMFLDLRGFTTFAESRPPEEVVDYLNTLFHFMIELVNDNNGIIHQLLDDGFMAIFGAPIDYGTSCLDAVRTSHAIIQRVAEEHEAGRIPATRVGIGLHAGEVVVGSVGSDIHKEYKATGDIVNLAARVEQLNKEFDSSILASETVVREAGMPEDEITAMGEVPIRGRNKTLHLYRIA